MLAFNTVMIQYIYLQIAGDTLKSESLLDTDSI